MLFIMQSVCLGYVSYPRLISSIAFSVRHFPVPYFQRLPLVAEFSRTSRGSDGKVTGTRRAEVGRRDRDRSVRSRVVPCPVAIMEFGQQRQASLEHTAHSPSTEFAGYC